MSRSFGDTVAASVGVICTPDITARQYNADDRYLVLGSDGVFDFLSANVITNTVSSMLAKKKSPSDIAERLVADSVRQWQRSESGNYVDDITAVVVVLNAHPGKGKLVL